jgi:hypothetical protein
MAKKTKLYSIVNTKTHTHISIPKNLNNSNVVQAAGRKVLVKKGGRAHRFHHYNYHKKKATGQEITYRSKILNKGNSKEFRKRWTAYRAKGAKN